jgi:hypothetical protein
MLTSGWEALENVIFGFIRRGVFWVRNFTEIRTMKTLILITAAIGLSTPAAFAECDYHKVNAAVDVDQSMTTASIQSDDQKGDEVVLLEKTDRLPEDAAVAE